MGVSIGNFIFHETEIKGVYIIDMKKYDDSRGFFMETYKRSDFESAGLSYDFVQDNHSLSGKGVLRGMHFQKKHSQAKLICVISGEVFDAAVDLRKDSINYGKSVWAYLSGDNHRQILIPKGFAHGFMVLSDQAEIIYKCDDYYHPEYEGGIAWDDPDLAIPWPSGNVILNDKDKNYPTLAECRIAFDMKTGAVI